MSGRAQRHLLASALLLIASCFYAASAAGAEPSKTPARIGFVDPVNVQPQLGDPAFWKRLEELGWVKGRNLVVEGRWAQGQYEKLPALFTELVELKVDALVTYSTPAGIAAKRATRTMPIIDASMGDPVGNGLAASLARPGGNLTGLSYGWTDGIGGKLVELLHETVPRLTAVAWLTNPDNAWEQRQRDELVAATRARGLKLHVIELREAADLERALRQAHRRAQGLLVFGDPFLWSHRKEITAFAASNRIPAIYGMRAFVDAGGLMAYGPNTTAAWRRTAEYLDKVLSGVDPADLPIEQPTQYLFTVNLRVATALSISVPETILVRADDVIR